MQYSLDGSLAVNQLYNSNIILSAPAQDVFGTSLDAIANLAAKEPHWEVGGQARVNSQFYYPASGIDMNNVYLDGTAASLTERSRWSLAGNYTNAWYLASDPQAVDLSGLVLARLRRKMYSVRPSWTYALDETTTATLGYLYSQGDFEFSGGGRSQQESHTASSTLARRLDERLTASLDLSYSHFRTNRESPDFATRNDYVNAMLGFEYAVDDTLNVGASGGVQYTRTENEAAVSVLQGFQRVSLDPPTYVPIVASATVRTRPPPSTVPIFSVTVRKRFETSQLNLNYSRQISPSFNGLLLEMDRVALTGSRRLAETLNGSLGFAYYTQNFSGGGTAGSFSTFSSYAVDGSLAYRWSPHWTATASYRYLRRDGSDTLVDSDSHAVFMNLRYDFDSYSF